MKSSWGIPELDSPSSVIRISPDVNVPVTTRLKKIIDTPAFRRLSRISQLGMVAFVYPGATHTRMEHSLGVYRNAIDFLQRLSGPNDLGNVLSEYDVKLFLVAALLHDIGHWPFCHVLEDLHLTDIPRHEELASRLITQGELSDVLVQDWGLAPQDVSNLLSPTHGCIEAPSDESVPLALLQSMLSGPIDIDKLDYLERDSLHAGVPYGRNFDRNRLVNSLCIDSKRNRLAITDKGRTAAEMMVFARYVMFSEVYWHHAVRSATAMLQRAVYEIRDDRNVTQSWIDMAEQEMICSLLSTCGKRDCSPCVEGLFGRQRLLYKRVAQFDFVNNPEQHRLLARKPYAEIVDLSSKLASKIQSKIGLVVNPHEVLIDAPPVKLEVQFQLDVRQRDGSYRTLGELSPVVHALATKQFDDMVKRVRIFVHPRLRDEVACLDFAQLVLD
jgi:HD superfamily phosphohydrolase